MTVSDGMRKWEFLIDRVKFIVGSNQKERHQIHQALRLLQSKSESEWRKETHSEASLLIDDEQLALKKVNFFCEYPSGGLSSFKSPLGRIII